MDKTWCNVCKRNVTSGLVCKDTVCPWALSIHKGNTVLADPLYRRIK
jgi:hypothetical protein